MSVTLTGCEGVLEAARSVSRGRREESERARLGFVEATKDMQKIHEAALAALAAKIEAVSQESKLKVLGLERELEVLRAENTSLTKKVRSLEDRARELEIASVRQKESQEQERLAAIERERAQHEERVADARRAQRMVPYIPPGSASTLPHMPAGRAFDFLVRPTL